MMDFWFKYFGWNQVGTTWKIRCHELMWCEIDEYGFATITNKREWASATKNTSRITLPRPIRDERSLNALMHLLN